MKEKLTAAGLVPSKTTFSNGRMATKEAWNFCQTLCKARGIRAPTLRTFKHHLQNGNLIKFEKVPNPFGGNGPEKVYAITPSAVGDFVEELDRQGDALHVVVEKAPNGQPGPQVPSPAIEPKAVAVKKEFTVREAFHYVQKTIGRQCELNSTTFGFYLVYDVIPSRREKSENFVDQGDLDAYLELAPDGIYANHVIYETAAKRGPDDLSMKDAYEYYRDIDPNPITLTIFRSLVAAGIVAAIRTANDPKALVIGFKKKDINAFLASRHRLVERNQQEAEPPKPEKTTVSPEVAKLLDEALASARRNVPGSLPPEVRDTKPEPKKPAAEAPPAPKPEPKPEPKTPVAKKPTPKPNKPAVAKPAVAKAPPKKKDKTPPSTPRWVSTKDAYAYYAERSPRAYTDSWFRDKVYRSDLFRKKIESDKRPNNPSGKKYLVDLNSVDEYLAKDPKTQPRPQKSWPIEKAYHKFNNLIPAGLSMLQFKRLVNTGLIKSFTRNSVVHVRLDAVEAYFEGMVEFDESTVLQMGAAYDYYCSRCSDPVAKAHFSRWVTQGEIEGAEKNGEGLWTITVGAVDDFTGQYPSGRLRTNRNSRVVSESRQSTKKSSKRKTEAPAAAAPMPSPGASAGTISISLSDYKSPTEMKKALEMLTSQGFEVSVKP